MPKLRLDLDELQVETFAVTRQMERETGTVRGHAKATYGCTEGWDGCANVTLNGYTCDIYCSESVDGVTCVYVTVAVHSCGPMASCESGGFCHTYECN